MATRKATVGETITITGHGWVTYEGEVPTTEYTVNEACAGNGGGGSHYCPTHPDADVHNNWMMSSHVEGPGKHIEVWICSEHGPEVP